MDHRKTGQKQIGLNSHSERTMSMTLKEEHLSKFSIQIPESIFFFGVMMIWYLLRLHRTLKSCGEKMLWKFFFGQMKMRKCISSMNYPLLIMNCPFLYPKPIQVNLTGYHLNTATATVTPEKQFTEHLLRAETLRAESRLMNGEQNSLSPSNCWSHWKTGFLSPALPGGRICIGLIMTTGQPTGPGSQLQPISMISTITEHLFLNSGKEPI